MNTAQNSKANETTVLNQALMEQFTIIKDFFQTDSSGEMIESLNAMVEDYLFSDGLDNVTLSMRKHIVNQLRVATLIARLENSYKSIAKSRDGLA